MALSRAATLLASGDYAGASAQFEEYRWRLDERMPPRIYVRLEARDEAGNVGVFEAPEPVTQTVEIRVR